MEKLFGTLVYVMLDKPRACYDETKGQEYKCGIVVDEDTADTFNALYPKQAAKKVKATDFEAIYKCPPPEDSGKNVYVITLKKNSVLANGNPVPDKYRPRVLEKQGNTVVDVTFTKLPSNGSKGAISVDHYEGKMGNVARLKNVLVTEMIEYVRTTVEYEVGSEFDESPVQSPKVEPPQEQKKPVVKKAAKQEEDDIPF
jgi:hypothetical protein